MNDSPDPVIVAPRAVLIVKVDTMGDLVLFAPTLRALKTAWPETRLAVLIREGNVGLGPLLCDGIEWITTPIDAFGSGPVDHGTELAALRRTVDQLAPDIVVAATSRRTWLEVVLASIATGRRIRLGRDPVDPFFATQLKIGLKLDPESVFTESIDTRADEPDWQRNLRIADHLLQTDVPRAAPQLLPLPDASRSAHAFLRSHGLISRKYVVCAPAGFANVSLKTWPADRFGAVITHLRERWRQPVLLVGGAGERNHLEEVARVGGGAAVWVGQQGDLAVLSALLSEAALYVGNDTGAMHVASALGVPVVGIFGGGTWPRFVPATANGHAVVHPLPCFGCGWDCAFGDAPCVRQITVADVTRTVDEALSTHSGKGPRVVAVQHLSDETRAMMGQAAATYRTANRSHLARQHKLEELTALAREKDAAISEKEASLFEKERAINEKEAEIHAKQGEILALKAVCDEREKVIFHLAADAKEAQVRLATLADNQAILERMVRNLPADVGVATKNLAAQAVHIRNIEAMLRQRDTQIEELKATVANLSAGHTVLEQAKHYGTLLSEKEAVIRSLHRTCEERGAVISQLLAESNSLTGQMRKARIGFGALWRHHVSGPIAAWAYSNFIENYWMQIGVLRQHEPRPLHWDALPSARPGASAPRVAIVTPSFRQAAYIERTLRSVLDQRYPGLLYVVQDGGSQDGTVSILERYSQQLQHWESVKDNGQADAVIRGFRHIADSLEPDDLMAWLNSDDLLAPGALGLVANTFAKHPEVDVVYGHRIIIDHENKEVGRWVMPRHDPESLEWVDYVPQETLFWRKRAWDTVGGLDPSFQFALDWDLLARFRQAGCKTVRLPYFLGAFRVHPEQKTSQVINTMGAEEMRRIRTRFHGERQDDANSIELHARRTRVRGVLTARLLALGIRW